MIVSLIIFAVAVAALLVLSARFGVDSRDGDDWLNHRPI
jgi:hypothetical protein